MDDVHDRHLAVGRHPEKRGQRRLRGEPFERRPCDLPQVGLIARAREQRAQSRPQRIAFSAHRFQHAEGLEGGHEPMDSAFAHLQPARQLGDA